MAFALGPKARDRGYRLSAHDTIGSTSTAARDRASAGDPGRLWVTSLEQTAGHGRRGRAWQTPRGNLAASLLLRLPADRAGEAATLGFAAGLALDAAIRETAPSVSVAVALDDAHSDQGRLRLKWPNDVLIDGAKVAGILLQAVPGAHGGGVVLGIGVNVRHAPAGLPYAATSLWERGALVTAEALFGALAEAWVDEEAAWSGGHGFAALRDRWLERAAGVGAAIAVRLDGEVFRGTFETIDSAGRLVVRAADGAVRVISAGEVHLGAVATVER